MTSLFFDHALLPEGWARDVRMVLHDGTIASIEQGAAPQAEDIRHPVALPGLANLHSHAFQRAMAGLTEVRGPAGDSFWTWRDLMYRFVDRMDPDDIAAIAAQAYVEMLESGFTRVGEFHYLHHAADGAPYANPAETSLAIMAAAAESGIGLTPLKRFEKTGAITLRNLIAILRAMDLLDGLTGLVPDADSPSPLDVLAEEQRKAKRARKRAPRSIKASLDKA